jgi:hypothetical protein
MDPLLEIQGAIIARLKATAAVTALVASRVYDEPPQDQNGNVARATYPYVSMGPSNFQAEQIDCVEGGEFMIQIDAWSMEPGQPEVRRIADAIRVAFRDFEPTLSTNALVTMEHWRTDYIRDEGRKQASIRFTGFVEQP